MSIKQMSLVWKLGRPDVSSCERLVLLALADHANDDGECWPGISAVCCKTGMVRRCVQRHIHKLQELGLLQAIPRTRKDGSQTSNTYLITLEKGEQPILTRGGVTNVTGGWPQCHGGGGSSVTPD